MLKRRKKKKTDYKQRLALLTSKKPRIVVRRTLNNIHIQIVQYEPKGDKTIIEVSSKNLRKYGWKGHFGNIPSAYLCGLVAGLKAIEKDVDSAVLDIGLQTSVSGSSLYAAAKGARDAGLSIPLDEKKAPDMDRISGVHISNYAKTVKSDTERYNRQFSIYLKNGPEPEKFQEHFEEVKKKILEDFGFRLEDFSKEGEKEETTAVEGKKEKPEDEATLKEKKGVVETAEDEEEWEDVE